MQLFRRGLDKFEEPLAPRRDMSTVLDIGGRPETLGGGVVPLVEERVERLQDERFVLSFGRGHGFTSYRSLTDLASAHDDIRAGGGRGVAIAPPHRAQRHASSRERVRHIATNEAGLPGFPP